MSDKIGSGHTLEIIHILHLNKVSLVENKTLKEKYRFSNYTDFIRLLDYIGPKVLR